MLTTEHFIKARKDFKKEFSRHTWEVTCAGWYTEEGGYVPTGNYACHAGLSYSGAVASPLFIFSGFQRDCRGRGDTKVLGQRWFDYQKAHPIWGACVLNETFEDVYENGWVFDTNYSRSALCSAVFATRWPTEHQEACRPMFTYIDAGMHPDMAFVLSTISYQEEGSADISYRHHSGHMPCTDGAPDTFVENFLSYKDCNPGKIYRDSVGHNGIDKVFYTGGYGEFSTVNALVKESVSGKEGYTPSKDIFFTEAVWRKELQRKDKDGWVISDKESLSRVVEALNKYREEVLA